MLSVYVVSKHEVYKQCLRQLNINHNPLKLCGSDSVKVESFDFNFYFYFMAIFERNV